MIKKLTPKEIEILNQSNYKNSSKKIPICVILNDIRSRINVGTTYRICDAFAIDKIYLSGITPTPPHRDIHKTALGAENSVSWNYYKEITLLLKKLKKQNYITIGIEQTNKSESLKSFNFPKQKTALIFGNEINGISEDVFPFLDYIVEIPQYGIKHSINIGSAVSILCWEMIKTFDNEYHL